MSDSRSLIIWFTRRADGEQDAASSPSESSSPGACCLPRAACLRRWEDETLLVWRDALLVLNLGLDVLDLVGRLDIERDVLSSQCFHKDLHNKVWCESVMTSLCLKFSQNFTFQNNFDQLASATHLPPNRECCHRFCFLCSYEGIWYRHEKIWQHPLMMSVWIPVSLLLNKDSRVSHLAVSNVSEIAIPSHTSYGRILRVLYHMLPIPRIAAIIPWMISRMRSLICRHIHHHASYTSRFISTRNSEI